ncbi:hypothetical protein EC973_003142 [Apophysomyces ossiformis]|uniref:GH18 domain-containing protein n=1 Tax=Apophysomyces ossiformis TaxID=679940 RepID=A0A8H7BM13_9FUNG|nr:hypothetical protein EC973_003142 [Apophysomyces ossiformis]
MNALAICFLASLWALTCFSVSAKMVIGYFPNWLYEQYPLENIPFDRYTHINYAFAILNNEDYLPSFTDDWAVENYLPKLVSLAHRQKTKVMLSVGGWTGSKKFSPMVATAESRKRFIDWNLEFIDRYKTDGVDIDWEYPGRQAAGCNDYSEADADNLLLLLKELREALDSKFNEHKVISMAVHVLPFVRREGEPMTDMSSFVPYFDFVNIMSYDINGAWANVTGPNAPFRYQLDAGVPFSYVDSIKAWQSAGVPSSKINAGLPFYGRSMTTKEDMVDDSQYQTSVIGAPKGDSDDAYWADPYCPQDIAGVSGIWKWKNLRSEGLVKDDWVTTDEKWDHHWDNVSQTPWLYNKDSNTFISYDDPFSIGIKVKHALCEDLAGVMVWDIHQDNGELIDAVSRIHGPRPADCSVTETNPTNTGITIHSAASVTTAWASVSGIMQASQMNQAATASMSSPIPTLLPASRPSSNPPHKPTQTCQIKKKIKPGSKCRTAGQEKCVESGQSNEWVTCDNGHWIARNCPDKLVCFDGPGYLYCGYPKENSSSNSCTQTSSTSHSSHYWK